MKANDVPVEALKRRGESTIFQLQPKTLVFFSRDRLPQSAGIATLRFADDARHPIRREGQIILPSRQGELNYYVLKGGLQFIVTVDSHTYFGGTDDNPDDDENVFLTEVTSDALAAFHEGGDVSFFESLKPEELRLLEQEHPDGVTRRQGDVFAFWCPAFGKTEKGLVSSILGRYNKSTFLNFEIDAFTRNALPVLDTRHTVDGSMLRVRYGNVVERTAHWTDMENYFFGELQAPDHKPLSLGNRPHRLFQTANLVRPTSGDCGDR